MAYTRYAWDFFFFYVTFSSHTLPFPWWIKTISLAVFTNILCVAVLPRFRCGGLDMCFNFWEMAISKMHVYYFFAKAFIGHSKSSISLHLWCGNHMDTKVTAYKRASLSLLSLSEEKWSFYCVTPLRFQKLLLWHILN